MQRTTTRGFSLLEVLIALVVLSVGLLGLAALQAEGLRGSSNAQQRFQAVRLATDITDRMRANIQGAAADGYVIAAGQSAAAGAGNACADVGTAVAATDCTAAQMAAYDLFLWRQDLVELLPVGNGAITKLAASRFTVTITWSDRGQAQNLITEVQL